MVVYTESESLPAAMAVPKYRPDSAAAACSVLPAACAVVAATPPARTTAVRVASEMARNPRREGVGVSVRVIVDPFVLDVPSLARRTWKRISMDPATCQGILLNVFEERTY
jgi:hypothetical protein